MLSARHWWICHRATLLWPAMPLLAALSVLKLSDEFRRLLWETAPGTGAAIDLTNLYGLVHRWFAGMPVYYETVPAMYPPASFVMLWPLVGWLELTPARWLSAVSMVTALAWLAYLMIRESGAATRQERALVLLLLLSMNAVGVTIGVGQLGLYLLPMLVVGVLRLQRGPAGWPTDLLAAVVLLPALVKPTLSVPFFWIVLFGPRRLRPAVLVVLGYVALTLIAALLQGPALPTLLGDWLARSSAVAAAGGYGNLYIGLTTVGLERWNLLASGLVLAALGVWIYRYRDVDVWLLLGVTALVARLWAYHAVYDDVLVLLAMVALFRIATGHRAEGRGVLAGLMLGTVALAMLAPARLFVPPGLGGLALLPPWGLIFPTLHVAIWVVLLVFLVDQAHRDRRARESFYARASQ